MQRVVTSPMGWTRSLCSTRGPWIRSTSSLSFSQLENPFAPTRNSLLAERARTPSELNFRLSTCLQYRKSGVALQMYEQARRERLPFDDLSMEYVVYNLSLNGQFRRAEQLLNDYTKEERLVPSQKAYHYVLIAYARSGEFARLQEALEQMHANEVPITEETYQLVLQNAERFYWAKDYQNLLYRKKLLRQKTPLSHAPPSRFVAPSLDEFLADQPSASVEGASNETSRSTSPLAGSQGSSAEGRSERQRKDLDALNKLFGKAPAPNTRGTSSGLISDKDLASTKKSKIAGAEESEENFLDPANRTGTYRSFSDDQKRSEHAPLLRAINEVAKHQASAHAQQRELLVGCTDDPLDEEDLGSFMTARANYFEVLIPDPHQMGNFRGNQNKERICSLTGARLDASGKALVDDLAIPYHDNDNALALTSRYHYLDTTKEPITETFSVERKIDEGRGAMLHIDEEILFSLSYDRGAVAGQSLLGALSVAGMEGTPAMYAALVNGYGRAGHVDAIERTLQEMHEIGVMADGGVANRTIQAFARNLVLDRMEDILSEARRCKIPLTTDTLQALLYAYGRSKNTVRFEATLAELRQAASAEQVAQDPTVLYMQAAKNESNVVEDALKVVRQTENKASLGAYDGVMAGYAAAKNWEQVAATYKQMVEENVTPSEYCLDLACTAFHKTRDLNQMVRAIYTLYRTGYVPLNGKRAEGLIDLLCGEGLCSEALQLMEMHKEMPFLLKPRHFTFVLEQLLKKEKVTVINKFSEPFRWPSYIAMAMLYGPSAREAGQGIAQHMTQQGVQVTKPVLEAIAYYLMEKNDLEGILDLHRYATTELKSTLNAPFYVFALLAITRERRLPELASMLKEIHDQNIRLSELSVAASERLSYSKYCELNENLDHHTQIDLDHHRPKEAKTTSKVLSSAVREQRHREQTKPHRNNQSRPHITGHYANRRGGSPRK